MVAVKGILSMKADAIPERNKIKNVRRCESPPTKLMPYFAMALITPAFSIPPTKMKSPIKKKSVSKSTSFITSSGEIRHTKRATSPPVIAMVADSKPMAECKTNPTMVSAKTDKDLRKII